MPANGGVIAEAFVALKSDSSGLARDIKRDVTSAIGGVDRDLDRATSKSNAFSGGLGKIAAAAGGLFVLKQGVSLVGDFVKEAEESNSITKITAQIIEQTGGAANLTSKEIGSLADTLSRKTGIDDEAIQAAENVILTFKGVRDEVGAGNDIFTRATKASLDLSTVLGGDTAGAATQLSKALEDPIKGITALTRSGVTFTDAEKEKIKTLVESGRTLEAQKIILAAIEGQLGGTAEAGATASDKFKVAFGNFKEGLGNVLLPIITKASEFAVTLFDKFSALPEPMQKIIVAGGLLAAGLAGAAVVLAPLGAALAAIVSPVGLVVVAIAALVAGLAILFQKNEGFRELVTTVWAGVKTAISGVVDFVKDTLFPALVTAVGFLREKFQAFADFVREIWPQIQEAIGHVIEAVKVVIQAFITVVGTAWKTWGDEIFNIVKIIFDQVKNTIETVIGVITGIIKIALALINGDWDKAWEALKDVIGVVFDFVKSTVTTAFEVIGQLIEAALSQVRLVWDKAWDGLKGVVSGVFDFIKELPSKVVALAGGIGAAFVTVGEAILDGIKRGLGAAADLGKAVVNAIIRFVNKQLIDKINDLLEIQVGPVKINPPDIPHIPELASGGLVVSPTLASLHANEAVLPLSGSAAKRAFADLGIGGSPILVNVNFNGVVPTQAEAFRTGQAVGSGIEDAQRRRDARLAMRTA